MTANDRINSLVEALEEFYKNTGECGREYDGKECIPSGCNDLEYCTKVSVLQSKIRKIRIDIEKEKGIYNHDHD